MVSESAAVETPGWSRYRVWIALAIFVFALLIRLPGIGWGLKNDLHNQSYHPDEEVNWRASRRIEPSKLSFTPGSYSYGSFYLTTMRVAGDIGGLFGPPSETPEADWDYIARGELAGRIVSALAGAGLAATLFWLGTLLFGEIGGLTAGLIGSVAPGLVMHSRFATVDIFGTLWVALVAVSAVRLLDPDLNDKKLWRHLILAGVFAGFAAGTKYTGGAAILMVLAALAFVKPKEWVMKGAISLLLTVVVFVATTPGILLDKEAFWRDFKFEQAHVASGHGLLFVDTMPGYFYQLSNLFLVVGLVSVLMGLGGLIWAAWRRERWAFVLLAFSAVYFLVIGGAAVKFGRYCFPLVPGLAIGAGYAVAQGFAMKRRGAWLVAGGILGVAGVPGQGGLIGTVNVTASMLAPDSRDLMARQIKKESTDATTVGLPEDPWFWSPPLFPNSTATREMFFRHGAELEQEATKPRILQFKSADASEPASWNVRLLTDLRPDYVTFSDLENYDLERLKDSKAPLPDDVQQSVDHYKAFIAELEKSYAPVEAIGPSAQSVEDLRYVLPTVYLWKRK